jgi:hypothetical protein
MAILWRQLLDTIGVRWIDRGHNVGGGHVNIRCPWCGDADPSFHLGIQESTGHYFCLRSQAAHRGKSTPWLLLALGVEPYQIDALIRDYADDSPPTRTAAYRETTPWEKFKSAADYPAALDYLRRRGLDPAAVLARRYDMRFTTSGPSAWRILLPLRLNFDIVGWTGRAISQHAIPRYRANDPSNGTALYVPIYPTEATRTIVIVEGPFDAIAIADAYHPTHEIIAIAVTGLNVNPPRRQHLADIIGLAKEPHVLLTLDEDQLRNTVYNFKNVLAQGTGIPHPQSFPLPPGTKDAGEMSREEIRIWLTGQHT